MDGLQEWNLDANCDEPLNMEEKEALDMIRDLFGHIGKKIVQNGESRSSHMADIVFHIHGLQTIIMSQAAGRMYPGKFRLLGE